MTSLSKTKVNNCLKVAWIVDLTELLLE